MRIEPAVPLKGAGSSATTYRRLSAIVGLLLTAISMACVDSRAPTSPPPSAPALGVLVGDVTLLGDDGPTYPSGYLTLYASPQDLESRNAKYRTLMHSRDGSARVYDFAIGNIAAGDYYVLACWSIGCGEYRYPGTNELRTVRIRRGTVTRLHFGL